MRSQKYILVKLIQKKNGYRNSELLYGIIQSEIKNYKNAINIFKKLINKKKFIIESYYNLGIVYQKIKKYELSIKFLKKSINVWRGCNPASLSRFIANISLAHQNKRDPRSYLIPVLTKEMSFW